MDSRFDRNFKKVKRTMQASLSLFQFSMPRSGDSLIHFGSDI